MAINKAYLNARHDESSDECMTPFYAVEPLLKYIPRNKTVWCPFDKEWSAFVKLLSTRNEVIHSHIDDGKDFFTYKPEQFDIIISNPPFSCKDKVLQRCYELSTRNEVIHSHIDDGKDFFTYKPEQFDIIISNPPFSCKDKVLQRCYELNKPFAMLLPVSCIQGKKRVEMFMKNGLQILAFDLRVDYHTRGNMQETTKATYFGSAFFCKDILPLSLMFAPLKKYDQSLGEKASAKRERFYQPSLFEGFEDIG